MNEEKNKFKLFYSFNIKCESPISVGNGDNINTEHDVILYSDNTPYVPASTLAGCLFSRSTKALSLYSIGSTEGFSPLFVSDGIFEEAKLSKRDGNKLDYENKVSLDTAVFDYETVEKDSIFTFFVEYTAKKSSEVTKEEVQKDIINICSNINNGLYRLGFKQNRGLGKLKVVKLYEKYFDFSNFILDDYLNFLDKSTSKLVTSDMDDITNQIKELEDSREKIIAKLRPVSLINIRCASRLKEKADTISLTLNDKCAVVPGSSLNGALRSYAYKLANKEGKQGLFRDENKCDVLDSTKYVIEDLYIKGHLITKQRTRINRFTGGTDNQALFDEQVFMPDSLINGKDTVEFKITFLPGMNPIAKVYIKKAVEALCKGLVAVGGGTSIGYGIFEGSIEEA